VATVVETFADSPFRWWFSGGRALELYLGSSWRDHADIDVGINRCDAVALPSVLTGWDIHVAAAGRLEPWTGMEPDDALNQNNLWCRREFGNPWSLDVTLGNGDTEHWIYRRDPTIRLPWADAVLFTTDRTPCLAPDLQLLFKSKNYRDKDDVDARMVIPRLEEGLRDRLAKFLSSEHPWQELISNSVGPF